VSLTAALLTVSSSRSAGRAEDRGGPELERFARGLGAEVIAVEVVPDDRPVIEDRLRHFADATGCSLVLTTGGTGFAPDDVTPEATRAVIEREAPGLAEAMRAASREHTPHWMLSRAVAGVRGRTLIVNFPGSPKAIGEAGAAIADSLPHALRLLRGEPDGHRA
jgi:molybdenum cofactor synthesis domain-containing protein